MGKEWYSWGRSLSRAGEKESSTANGCMGGMLHYFDFHHLLFSGGGVSSGRVSSPEFAVPEQQDMSSPLQQTKGLEAPRNSLEIDEQKASAVAAAVAATSLAGEEEFKDIPIGIQIAPAFDALAKSSNKKCTSSSESETPRTPSLVARLMGIDGLPEPPSLSSPAVTSSKKPHKTKASSEREKKNRVILESLNNKKQQTRQPLRTINSNVLDTGSQSLPDTPRPSSARYWDVDHRLSLQINKENRADNLHELAYLCKSGSGGIVERSLPLSPVSCHSKPRKKDHRRVRNDENKIMSQSTHEHAKEIVKQVKEAVNNRRSGSSIGEEANSKRINARAMEIKKEIDFDIDQEKIVQAKPKPASNVSPLLADSTMPAIPRAALEDHIPNLKSFAKTARAKPSRPPPPPPVLEEKAVTPAKCKKDSCERFARRIKKLSSSPAPPPPQILLPAPDNSLPLAVQSTEAMPKFQRTFQHQEHAKLKQAAASTSKQVLPLELNPEYKYVKKILERGGFMTISNHSFKCYFSSSSSPVDPIIFHLLELDLPFEEGQLGTLRYRWNRKLLFHLVQEILSDLLLAGWSNTPGRTNAGAVRTRTPISGGDEPLLKRLWEKIGAFPAANCQVLGDIDALVAGDLRESNVRRLLKHPAVTDEADDVTDDVVHRVLDELLVETAASLSLSEITCFEAILS